MMVQQEIRPAQRHPNLPDYDAAYSSFDWTQVEREFDWYRTGKLNVAHPTQ